MLGQTGKAELFFWAELQDSTEFLLKAHLKNC